MDGLIVMIIVAATVTCISVYYRTRSELTAAMAKHQAAADRVTDLKIETEKLEREVKLLRTDARLIESYARQSLGLVRSGDVVIKIGQEPRDSTASPTGMQLARLDAVFDRRLY